MMEEVKRLELNQDLILTLDLNEEIIQFNKESERLTGYTRDEILHKKFSDLLLPEESVQQWKELFESIRQSMWIDNFILPLKIKNKQTYMITWSGFLVKDESGAIKNICIFGKPIQSEIKPNKPADFSSNLPLSPPTSVSDSDRQKTNEDALSKQIPYQSSELPPFLSVKQRELEKKVDSLKKPAAVVFKEIPEQSGTVSSRQENLFSSQEKKSIITEKSISNDYEKKIKHSFNKPDAPSDQHLVESINQQVSSSSPVKPVTELQVNNESEEPMKYHGVKKMRFASKRTGERESVKKSVPEKYLKSLATMESNIETTSKKIDSFHETLQDLTQKYDLIAERIAELEKKDRRWQKKHLKANDSDSSLEKDIKHSVDELKENKPLDPIPDNRQQPETEQEGFFLDPFGLKRQQKELTSKQQQLETRSKKLEAFEAQLLKERSIFNARVEEFSRWREKLMNLESAIEKRRQELVKQEKTAGAPRLVTPQNTDNARGGLEKHVESPSISDETLDKIPQSAAILQRGIVKQSNGPFEEMLGYPKEELVEKSFFDFVALEGLSEIEKYYLDRLKGDNVTMYTTVFSTKNNQKIPVEVSIKQTVFNGEKAEIVIVTSLDKKNSNGTTSSGNEK
jgi:PAS domain S-box-containing protein